MMAISLEGLERALDLSLALCQWPSKWSVNGSYQYHDSGILPTGSDAVCLRLPVAEEKGTPFFPPCGLPRSNWLGSVRNRRLDQVGFGLTSYKGQNISLACGAPYLLACGAPYSLACSGDLKVHLRHFRKQQQYFGH